MKLSPAGQEKIAEVLTQSLEIPTGARQAPIDPEKIANHLGIDVETGSAGAEGHLLRLKDKTIIQVSGRRSELERRFTIAHELGHYAISQVLQQRTPVELAKRLSKVNGPMEETLCNKFAAHLLLPTEWLRSTLSRTAITAGHVKQIAASAGASFQTTAWRMLDAGFGIAGFGIIEAADGTARWNPLLVPGIRTGYLKAPLADAPALLARAHAGPGHAAMNTEPTGLPSQEPMAIKMSHEGRTLRGFATGTDLGESRTGICFTTF